MPDPTVFRESIRTALSAFATGPLPDAAREFFATLGYGRKLFLIENCIYGVDIQPIATQIAKLRFFISLVVDQTVDPARGNFGIRPLPNLETKFVTADTLIQLEAPETQKELFELADVAKLQKELKTVRHNLFSAKTPRTKEKYRGRDKELREAITVELQTNGWASEVADKLAQWDPYNQNASADYFDPEWMFDRPRFDIVIGNRKPRGTINRISNLRYPSSSSAFEWAGRLSRARRAFSTKPSSHSLHCPFASPLHSSICTNPTSSSSSSTICS